MDDVVNESNPNRVGSSKHASYVQRDKLASAIIGLSLSDAMLEHVWETDSAKAMLDCISNVFQSYTLLNKLRARREFCTVAMKVGEKMLTYINRVQQLGSVLKSMNVKIDSKEMAMAIPNGLPQKYENIITTLDALGDNSDSFTLETVKSRLLQEEQRREQRRGYQTEQALYRKAVKSAQTRRNPIICFHCNRRGNAEDGCWDKHLALRPKYPPSRDSVQRQALVANTKEAKDGTEENLVCLLENTIVQLSSPTWYIDSGTSSHMTPDR